MKVNYQFNLIRSLIQRVRDAYNKDINILISDKHRQADFGLFGTKDVILYPKGTKIGRILIDTGIAKSWSVVNGSHWKNYEIPEGFSEIYIKGKHPHRITILQWEDKT